MLQSLYRYLRLPGVISILLAVLLAGCDPGGRLAQLTPQAPAATPVVLGVTAEPPSGIGPLATAGPELTTAAVEAPAIPPTPTYDAALPAWTILYYAGADNGRVGFVWDDLNEMEAAGPIDQVRIAAQVDWPESGPAATTETVRYAIAPDGDAGSLASPPVATLGEVNMGDPGTLADFLTWGITTYPANRYALILGEFGGGWRGCCFDATTGSGGSDYLSLTDLEGGLASAYSQTGTRMEIIAFAAGLMGQIDVMNVLPAYAAYAVASAGLMPGSSWDFQAVVAQLNAQPLVDGRQLAGDLVTAYVNYQRQLAGDEFVGMAAVDLARVPALSLAVESLALTLAADPALHGAIAADARRGAQAYGAAALTDNDQIAAVDLLHAAAILAESAPAGDLQTAATNVTLAVTDSLVAYDHGQGIPNGRGLAIYWPASPGTLDPQYVQVSRLSSWADYLAAADLDPALPTRVTVDAGPRSTVSIADPALLRSEVIGHRLAEVALVADQEAADGRRVLRQYEVVQPAPVTLPGGTSANYWRDGRHESLIIWDATAAFLADTTGTGDFATLRPVDASPVGSLLAAGGNFRPGGDEQRLEATAIFAEDDPAVRHLWVTAEADNGARLVGEIRPAAGDVFQPWLTFVGPNGALSHEPGVSLVFDAAGAIYHTTRPLPAGNFAVGVRATPLDSSPVTAAQPLAVDPTAATAGFRAYVDAAGNVQFLYPADWLPPVTQEGVTFTSNISGTAQLQVRAYPGWAADLAALQEEALNTFGEVSILLQEPTQVGAAAPVEAMRTAYGYESAEQGPRTGMFLTFLHDGVGYVVDMDAPREEETATLAAVDTIAATWQFLTERLGFGPERWATLNVGEYRVGYPIDFAYQAFNNWHRFAADAQTFVAVRIQPAGRTPAEAMSSLLETAAEGVAGFSADEPRRFFYGGHLWERNDFHYVDPTGGDVAGILLSRRDGETEIAVWAEAPTPADDLFQTIFLPTAADIERIPPPPAG
jgi:hypothetical protein